MKSQEMKAAIGGAFTLVYNGGGVADEAVTEAVVPLHAAISADFGEKVANSFIDVLAMVEAVNVGCQVESGEMTLGVYIRYISRMAGQ